ncbi:hypothetical protein SDC9_162381 [bioreactor metagenome]|uniref:Uncharacterized protein n=1 Tax=bioreactor metagenome TaxID=1076179 RepID=A0A645FNA3_9ZZZZ
MRIARQQARKLRHRQPHIGQHAGDALAALFLAQLGRMHLQALADDFLYRQARRQRRERVLKHHLHMPPEGLVVRTVAVRRLLPLRPGNAHLPLKRQQAQQRLRQRGFSRA